MLSTQRWFYPTKDFVLIVQEKTILVNNSIENLILRRNKTYSRVIAHEHLDVEPAFRTIMRKAPTVHFRGLTSSFGYALVERFLRSSVNLVVDDIIQSSLLEKYSTELEYSECKFYSSKDVPLKSGHRLMLIGFGPFQYATDGESGLEINELERVLVIPGELAPDIDSESLDSVVEVFDLLPRSCDGIWENKQISTWMKSLLHGEQSPPHSTEKHWWVSDIDVADALVRILLSEQSFPARLKVSGRRAWNQEQTLEELSLLYQRTKAGQTGNFGIEHLTSAPSPNIEVKSLVVNPNLPLDIEENARQRPDLSPIHDVLHRIDGDGWRPLVPIRTALMHTLAGYLE